MRDEKFSKPSSKPGPEARTPISPHPSRNLEPRARGYGIGGGYERPLRKQPRAVNRQSEAYGPVPHSGYYGAGAGSERFEMGQAGFNKELSWYALQYGEKTSGQTDGT